jgi:trk system potassium uptake protein TrkA
MLIIIAGAGELGTHLAKMLSRENHDIVMIDPEYDRLNNVAATNDIMTLQGDVTSHKLLMEAGVSRADLFIAVTPLESTNIVSAIMANELGAKLTVARVANSELLNRENSNLFLDLGIVSFVYPEKIAAHQITNSLHRSGVSTLVNFSGGNLSLLSVKIDKNAPIVYTTPPEAAEIYKMEYCVVAILRNGKTFIPHKDIHFEPDDTLYMVTDKDKIKSVLHYSGHKEERITQVMILGGTHTGRLIATELGKGYNVKIFEADREIAYHLSNSLNNTLVIHGDGTKIDLLIEEGLRNTDAFIAVTQNSEANILACLLAKSEGAKHTVAVVENLDYINLAERLGIDTIINKKLIAANHIYHYTLTGSVSTVRHLAATEAEVLEFIVSSKSKIIERPLSEINFPKDAIIGGYIRDKTGYIPTGSSWIQTNDHVIVFAMPSAIKEVSSFFK